MDASRIRPKAVKRLCLASANPKQQRQGKRKGKKVSAARLRLADWTIMLTNVPQKLLSVQEALVLLRCRWQIELLWKLWKQHGKLDTWRSYKPERILTEIYAKLLGLIITHWETAAGLLAGTQSQHAQSHTGRAMDDAVPGSGLGRSGAGVTPSWSEPRR